MHSNEEFGFKIAESAQEQLKRLAEVQEQWFRITVRGGGCSGLRYDFSLEEAAPEKEEGELRLALFPTLTLLVDPMSYQYLKKGALEYETSLERSKFKITNPFVKTSCRCGSSFNL